MKKKQKQGVKKNTAIILILCMTLGALTGCQAKAETEEIKQSIMVETVQPENKTITVESSFVGTIEPSSEVIVMPKIAGEVIEANFEVGDMVEAGDLLFTVDDSIAQITLASATATYESAQAGLTTAQATLTAQEANRALTQATAAETIGKMDTTEMELNSAVEKAQNAVGATKGTEALSKQSFASAQSVAENVNDNLDILKTNKSNAESYYNSLVGVKTKYSTIAGNAAITQTDLEQLALANGITSYPYNAGDTATAVADAFLSSATSYATVSQMDAAIATAKSSITSIETSVNSTEGSYDSYITAQVQAAIGMGTSADNVATAEQAKTLTEKYKADYEAFTKAKIVAGVNASLAGADATLAGAQASITNAGSSIKSSKANLDSAKLQIENTKIEAPVSGIITAKNVSVHNMASNSTQAYIIESQEGEKVVFYVAEKSILQMKSGNEVSLEKDGKTYSGSISYVAGSIDAATGLFKVEAILKEGSEALITGTSVIIKTITQKAENAITIPVSAVYYENEKAYVYLNENAVAKKVEVMTGISDNEAIEIISGLDSGSQVITNWDSKLKDGALVSTGSEVKVDE